MEEITRLGPWTEEDHHRFMIDLALRDAFKFARGLRRQVTDQERRLMAQRILDHIKLCKHRITKDPWHSPQHSVPCQTTDTKSEPTQ